jgi:ABC-type sulfate/molybdate transport systems ATPase subunit
MLDEPTLGQDHATRAALAETIGRLSTLGYGLLFVTHDDAFAAQIEHSPLRLSDGAVLS